MVFNLHIVIIFSTLNKPSTNDSLYAVIMYKCTKSQIVLILESCWYF